MTVTNNPPADGAFNILANSGAFIQARSRLYMGALVLFAQEDDAPGVSDVAEIIYNGFIQAGEALGLIEAKRDAFKRGEAKPGAKPKPAMLADLASEARTLAKRASLASMEHGAHIARILAKCDDVGMEARAAFLDSRAYTSKPGPNGTMRTIRAPWASPDAMAKAAEAKRKAKQREKAAEDSAAGVTPEGRALAQSISRALENLGGWGAMPDASDMDNLAKLADALAQIIAEAQGAASSPDASDIPLGIPAAA